MDVLHGKQEEQSVVPFVNSQQHLLAELERVDVQVQAAVWRARQVQTAEDGFQGLYLSEAEIDALLAQPAGLPRWTAAPGPATPAEFEAALNAFGANIASRKALSQALGIPLRLDELAFHFQLSPFQLAVLMIALAPEIDLRYERLYAYLQDDVTRKRPSVDLALNLLCPGLPQKLAARRDFLPGAPLIRHQLVELLSDPAQPHAPWLSQSIKVEQRVTGYLLEEDGLDTRLQPYARHFQPQVRLEELPLPADLKVRLERLVQDRTASGLILYFQGPYGVGKETTAAALCRESGFGLLVLDIERVLSTPGVDFATLVSLAGRDARLLRAVQLWVGFDVLLADDRRAWRERLLSNLSEQGSLAFLAGNVAWEPSAADGELPFLRVELPRPGYLERAQLWARRLDGSTHSGETIDLSDLAGKFRFSAGQIRDAVATARGLARWRDPQSVGMTMADLSAACRLQSNRKLAALARKITPHYTWGDIVLPPDRLEQLREISNQVKHRGRVFGEWGFEGRLSLGKGLNALFAGPSGTGKTMAAEILAGELRLDLYKIDLSTVVSKYIGETEKNLAQIFTEAETSNAILFFDEADALFGKRSEVRDAHDRYANLEIAYLLQKMEEYEGLVILATNLRKNMDEAFVRRMHFIVEFPFPSVEDRGRIWEGIWPAETPRSPDLDIAFLARRFELTGGSIRNIVLAAAFLAAGDGQMVTMSHLLHATRREYQKMGKMAGEREFGTNGGGR